MDGVSTVVIIIFALSIFSAITGKKDLSLDYQNLQPTQPVYNQVDNVSIPVESFSLVSDEAVSTKIFTFISLYRKTIDKSDAQEITDSLIKYCKEYDVNPKLMTALFARESGFNKYAVSSSGAMGLGQLLRSTADGLGVTDPFDIDQNVMGSTRYIRSLIDRFQGPDRLNYAVAGYFEGPNSVKRGGGFKLKSKSYVEDIYKVCNRI